MFEQSLSGLIKALRANKNEEQRVIQVALDEIRQEVRSSDWDVKAAAVLKLTYLEMLGHPHLTQHAFSVIECMSCQKFYIKAIGYLAASQSLGSATDVLLLVTNLIKKDLTTPTNVILSLNCLPPLFSASPQLVSDVMPDLLTTLNSSKPGVRKMAILVLGKAEAESGPTEQRDQYEYDDGSEHQPVTVAQEDKSVQRLRNGLTDPDAGVVSATVTVMLETARRRKDSRPFLALAPDLFDLLTSSTNNWMLIKIVKLFALLTPIEPRLIRKLLPPLTNLISSTAAFSLLYECINSVIVGGMLDEAQGGDSLAGLCVQKLSTFLEDPDQNLRYIALRALSRIMPTHPHLLSAHYDSILHSIDDPDISIRLRALEIVEVMASPETLPTIIKQLVKHLTPSQPKQSATSSLQAFTDTSEAATTTPTLPPSYRVTLFNKILAICSAKNYSNITDFPRYIDTLISLSYLSLSLPPTSALQPIRKLRHEFINVCARVRDLRPYAVTRCEKLLDDSTFVENCCTTEASHEVLAAAAWVVGEYSTRADPDSIKSRFFDQAVLLRLNASTSAVIIHNGVKLYARWIGSLLDNWSEEHMDAIKTSLKALIVCLSELRNSSHVELQERASELYTLLAVIEQGLDLPRQANTTTKQTDTSSPYDNPFSSQLAPPTCLSFLHPLFFSHDLNPVASNAQSLVPVPEELDLNSWLDIDTQKAVEALQREEAEPEDVDEYGRPLRPAVASTSTLEPASDTKTKKKKKKKAESPYEPEEVSTPAYSYSPSGHANPYQDQPDDHDIDSIPIVSLTLDEFEQIPSASSGKKKKSKARSPSPAVTPMLVDIEGELPPGAALPAIPTNGIETPAIPQEAAGIETDAVKKVVRKKKTKDKEKSSGKKKKESSQHDE